MTIYLNKPYKRSDRISDEIRHIMGEIFIVEFTIENGGMITVTDVEMTPDLSIAKVYVSFLNFSKTTEELMKTLIKNKKHLRYLFGKRLHMKYVPDLRFIYDDSLKKAERIGSLINKIHKQSNSNKS